MGTRPRWMKLKLREPFLRLHRSENQIALLCSETFESRFLDSGYSLLEEQVLSSMNPWCPDPMATTYVTDPTPTTILYASSLGHDCCIRRHSGTTVA